MTTETMFRRDRAILRATRALIQDETLWCRDDYYQDHNGATLRIMHDQDRSMIARMNVIGALACVSGDVTDPGCSEGSHQGSSLLDAARAYLDDDRGGDESDGYEHDDPIGEIEMYHGHEAILRVIDDATESLTSIIDRMVAHDATRQARVDAGDRNEHERRTNPPEHHITGSGWVD